MIQRLECYVRCVKCDITVGKVMATLRHDSQQDVEVWHNVPTPDPMPKYCKVCSSVLQRAN